MVTLTCIIVLPVDARQRAFSMPLYQTTWSGARAQGESRSVSTCVDVIFAEPSEISPSLRGKCQ
jgi:hypothetical protein